MQIDLSTDSFIPVDYSVTQATVLSLVTLALASLGRGLLIEVVHYQKTIVLRGNKISKEAVMAVKPEMSLSLR